MRRTEAVVTIASGRNAVEKIPGAPCVCPAETSYTLSADEREISDEISGVNSLANANNFALRRVLGVRTYVRTRERYKLQIKKLFARESILYI